MSFWYFRPALLWREVLDHVVLHRLRLQAPLHQGTNQKHVTDQNLCSCFEHKHHSLFTLSLWFRFVFTFVLISRPVPVLSAAPAAPVAPRQPSPAPAPPQTVTPPTTSPVAPIPSPAEQARMERERQRKREQERRRREAQVNKFSSRSSSCASSIWMWRPLSYTLSFPAKPNRYEQTIGHDGSLWREHHLRQQCQNQQDKW